MTEPSDKLESLPGMTRCSAVPCAFLIPETRMESLPSLPERPIVLLATANIDTNNISNNGLFQNVFFIYKLFESIGWLPVLFVN